MPININIIKSEHLLEKLNLVKNLETKKELSQKLNNLNLLKEGNNNTLDSDSTVEETNSALKTILSKYHSPKIEIKKTEINTSEVQILIKDIEGLIIKHNISKIDNDLIDYIKEENEIIHSNTINNNMNLGEAYLDKTYNGIRQSQDPFYYPTLFKVDYDKLNKVCLDEIEEVEEEFYLIDNREIFLVNNFDIRNNSSVIKSENNGISEKNTLIQTKSSSFRHNHKKTTVRSPNKQIRQSIVSHVNMTMSKNKSSNLLNQAFSQKSLLNKKSTLFKSQQITSKKSYITNEIVIVNEHQSQLNSYNFDKTKMKGFSGRDLIDKIYFLPTNSVVVLDSNEANKIGTMLLDYIRLEKDLEGIVAPLKSSNLKLEEYNKKLESENGKLKNDNITLKLDGTSKNKIVEEYNNTLKSKLEYSFKVLNEEKDLSDMDNSKILELINKNIDILTKKNSEITKQEDFLDLNTSMFNLEQNADDSQNNTLNKSIEFYVKKRVNNNNNPINLTVQLSPKK